MQSLNKIRKYEAGIIIGASIIYVVKRLFQYAGTFDLDVYRARAEGVKESVIWNDLYQYNHVVNTILPVILGGIFFLAGWYLFHYYVYPAYKQKDFSQKWMILLVVCFLCLSGSVQIYDSLKLYWRFRHDSQGNISGFYVFSLYRKLFLFTNTVAIVILVIAYEALAQLYYFFVRKIDEEGKSYYFLKHLLTATLILFILGFAVFAWVPVSFWNGIFAEFFFMPLVFIVILLAQQIYFKQVLPFIGKEKPENFLFTLFTAAGVAMIGSVLFEIVQIGSWYARGYEGFHFSARNYKDVFVQFLAFSFIAIFLAMLRRIFSREKISLTTAVSNKSAELSTLRAQINPHFLFNTLNTLYSVSLKEEAEKTAEGIQKLGDMMRFMLNENHQDRIPLSKEIEYLENYMDIQRMRIDESHEIEIKVNIQKPENPFMIAPMLLNPFIENAFKHGISFRKPSWIYITMTHDDKRLFFKVHNSLHLRTTEEMAGDDDSNGVGLLNVKKRLELIYPNRHTLDIQESEQDYFVSLSLLLS